VASAGWSGSGFSATGRRCGQRVHREDSRADAPRGLGADVIVGDVINPVDICAAMYGISRMFFNMSVSP
jgi:hypothetical protein